MSVRNSVAIAAMDSRKAEEEEVSETRGNFMMRFLRMEAAGGILLMLATLLALAMANSPLERMYSLLLSLPLTVGLGEFLLSKPLLLWINDGLMAVFFFLIGLELKRELLEGELANPRNILLPGIGAVGGMLIPALIYLLFNRADEIAVQGWAIPAATDIAFALGILSLLGSRVPTSIKVFLTSLAIFDDVGAILIIALFYTDKLLLMPLAIVGLVLLVLLFLRWRGVESIPLHLLLGALMWVAMLKSGVHATLAGVLLAFFIPLASRHRKGYSPLRSLEHRLHGPVAYAILPIFAFANAGLALGGVGLQELLHPVPAGIALGLFAGKQLGVFLFTAVVVLLKWATLPRGMSWSSLYGTAALAGVGFTMSLFIGSLAFERTGMDLLFDERLGILLGSLLSGLLGYFVLRRSLRAV